MLVVGLHVSMSVHKKKICQGSNRKRNIACNLNDSADYIS